MSPWRRSLAGILAVLAFGGMYAPGTRAVAQGYTPDPYNIVGEYNGQYAPYMYAVEPTEGSMFPNQSRLQERAGYRSANQFQSFVESIDGAAPEEDFPYARRGGLGTPYYRANRRFDSDFGRLYRPNDVADSAYFQEQNDRNQKYFAAMRERDPKTRAKLLREYNMQNLRAARSLSTYRNASERNAEPTAPGRPTTPPSTRDSLLELRRSTATSSRKPATTPASPLASPSPRSPRSGSRSSLDSLRAPASSGRLSPLPDDELESPRLRRSPSDVLRRSEMMDNDLPRTAPRRPSTRETAPPPPDR